MTTDRELLELAAKAAGGQVQWEDCVPWFIGTQSVVECEWNPLDDDGDALRLAVKLRLRIECNEASIVVRLDGSYESRGVYVYPDSTYDDDFNIVYGNHDKATRLAIVRAAAEIGKEKQND